MTVLALKVALAPLLVVLATLSGRRWGAAVAGVVTAVPVVAGPIITIEHGRAFGAEAARASLLGIAAAWVLITVPEEAAPPSSPPPAWDLPARVALTIALVLAITGAAGTLGPALSGVLTPFPIATSVVVAFSLAQDGPAASRSLLRGFVRALPGFAVGFFLAALAL